MNFNLISGKKMCLGPIGEQRTIIVVNQKKNRNKRTASHNAQPTNNDARRREQRFALPRARRPQPLFLFGRAG